MCEKTIGGSSESRNYAPDAMTQARAEAAEEGPRRSKFRPFIPSTRQEQRELDRALTETRGWPAEIEALHMDAQRMKERIERMAIRRAFDPRASREFDLALTHLEDVVMRATRGITS